jgi:hypothetical protein
MIFRRLEKAGCDWEYHFPRLMLVNMRPLLETMGGDEPEFAGYDPSAELAKEEEERAGEEESNVLRARLDEAHREAVEEAQGGPPPKTVEAYREVYGRLPKGWPPVVEE